MSDSETEKETQHNESLSEITISYTGRENSPSNESITKIFSSDIELKEEPEICPLSDPLTETANDTETVFETKNESEIECSIETKEETKVCPVGDLFIETVTTVTTVTNGTGNDSLRSFSLGEIESVACELIQDSQKFKLNDETESSMENTSQGEQILQREKAIVEEKDLFIGTVTNDMANDTLQSFNIGEIESVAYELIQDSQKANLNDETDCSIENIPQDEQLLEREKVTVEEKDQTFQQVGQESDRPLQQTLQPNEQNLMLQQSGLLFRNQTLQYLTGSAVAQW